jgi:K+-sensing histidine kinase KdpD
MDSYFASAPRASENELEMEIDIVVKYPVVQELLHTISGLIAVLDEHRQVVSLNDSFMQMLGIDNPSEILGLRIGEVLQCIHSHEEPNGCGTTKYCSTCGAAVAIVSTLALDKPVDRICALTANKDGITADISLLVRAHPIKINEKKFVLLLLQDITLEQLRAALERTFFHDIGNMLTGLLGASQLLAIQNEDSKLAEIVRQSALRLCNEVEIQKCLFKSDVCDYQVIRHEVTTEQLLNDLKNVYVKHTAALNKNLLFPESFPQLTIRTDTSLALRVMSNMVTNALEATDENGFVKVWFEDEKDSITFYVWNNKSISDEVQLRIFQRNFSTKEGAGRGIGTYSMQLLGEQILGGKVSFSSSEGEGTIFKFALRC